MNERIIQVHPKIFSVQPTFNRGIVVAMNMNNLASSPKLQDLLSQAIQDAVNNPIDLAQDPLITRWDEAHRQFESNPNKFPPAQKALLKRIQKPDASLPFINNVVAIMNYNSISSKIPVGGDDLAEIGSVLELRHANGSENFIPLGSIELEQPAPGEIIYVCADSGNVMCRRWNWRNGNLTAITQQTQSIVMNIDGLGEGCEATVLQVRDRIALMLGEFCNATTITTLLNIDNPSFTFSTQSH
jgi:DNA/RNA-binding domain of Phe-tRNA-synthetase-like protein